MPCLLGTWGNSMFEKCMVQLKMIRTIVEDGFFDEKVYSCEIIRHDEEEECIGLLLQEAKLPVISLDGVYECIIAGPEETLACRGKIIERFRDKRGNILVFQIENGFYKNNIN